MHLRLQEAEPKSSYFRRAVEVIKSIKINKPLNLDF